MFVGEYSHTIDEKGRMIMPAPYRRVLEEKGIKKVIITSGVGKCLVAYPPEEWVRLLDKIKNIPTAKKEVRDFIRKFCADAMECPLDEQGRLNIHPKLRDLADLTKEIVVIGVIEKMEIWNKETWVKQYKSISETYEANVENLDLGI
ncbi:MAG: division/cell wall cluster transcriptional repressor MraZ [bacterium]|nr:division/cell wall cluster transcriptional repressor MraZ [bacterium]